jgi:hypothetical protein
MKNSYKILVEKPQGRMLLGRTTRRQEDNIKTDFRETGREKVEWIHLAQDRDQWQALVKTIMKLRVT